MFSNFSHLNALKHILDLVISRTLFYEVKPEQKRKDATKIFFSFSNLNCDKTLLVWFRSSTCKFQNRYGRQIHKQWWTILEIYTDHGYYFLPYTSKIDVALYKILCSLQRQLKLQSYIAFLIKNKGKRETIKYHSLLHKTMFNGYQVNNGSQANNNTKKWKRNE